MHHSLIRVAVICLMLCLLTAPAVAHPPITVAVNQTPCKFDVPPMLEQGRTLVPFRAIGEALGITVHWDDIARQVIAAQDSLTVRLPIDQTTADVGGRKVSLDVPATIKNGRTLVPLRFFSQAFGAAVHFDDRTYAITISTGTARTYVLGYYYSYSYEDFCQNYRSLSGVAAKWYTLDDDARLCHQQGRRGIYAPDGYQDVLRLAAQGGTETYALVFEDDAAKLHRLLSEPALKTQFYRDVTGLLLDDGFSGVNIDFEMVREADGPALTSFITELAAAVHSQGKKLTLSVPARTVNGWHRAYDYRALGQAADQIAIMAYDRSPGQAAPQTPIYWVQEVVDYATERIEPQKILLGLGIYGYDWSTGGRQTVLWAPSQLGDLVSCLEDIRQRHQPDIRWDDEALQPYFMYTDAQGVNHTVWYENLDSLRPKLDLVREQGLGGVAFWRLGYTTPEFYRLLDSYFITDKL